MPKNLLNSVSNSQWIDWHSLDGAVLCSNSIGSICCIRQIAPVELELRGTDKGEFLGRVFRAAEPGCRALVLRIICILSTLQKFQRERLPGLQGPVYHVIT